MLKTVHNIISEMKNNTDGSPVSPDQNESPFPPMWFTKKFHLLEDFNRIDNILLPLFRNIIIHKHI